MSNKTKVNPQYSVLALMRTPCLSPLLHEHVNMLGRYDFTLPDSIAAGQLRPLRDPKSWQERFAPVE